MTDQPSPKQDPKTGRFVAGNGGNGGRPKGSRNKLGEAFVSDLYDDWKAHGEEVLADVRKDDPSTYMRVIASILPRDLNVNVNKFDEMSDDQVVDRLRELEAALRPFITVEGNGGTESGTAEETQH